MRTHIVLLSLAAVCLTLNSTVLATNQLVPIIAADANVTNLVSWWKFNEGSGVTAYDSAGTNDGTIHGATWTTDYTGIALDFDGDDYVEVSDDPSLRFTLNSRFSLCSWAKPGGGYIVGKMGDSAKYGLFGYNIGYNTTSNKYYFTVKRSRVGSATVSVYTGEIPQGDWSHVTAVYNNRDMKIYLDGELEGTGTFREDYISGPPDKDLTIGARSAGSSIDSHFIGFIDDVRIYNKALSDEEVRLVYWYSCPACPPAIMVSATECIFFAYEGGPNPESQVLSVKRMGSGTSNWEITENCEWILAEPESDEYTSEVDDVNIAVNISGLGIGLYECELSISDPNASNNPKVVSVTLHVLDYYELHVPSEFETIQDAIDMVHNGASIIVAPGTYTGDGNRDIDFKGKEITVRSINPNDPNVVAATVINCQGSQSDPHRGFYFHSGEDGNSILDGFTIRNGYAVFSDDGGGGICCIGSSPTITNCIITSNQTGVYYDYKALHGGGIYLKGSRATIVNCTINNNRTSYGAYGSFSGTDGGYGGGIYCEDSSPRIINCLLSNNVTGDGGLGDLKCEPEGCIGWPGGDGGHGGGIYIWFSSAVIEHCTITGNTTGLGGDGGGYGAPPGARGRGGGIYVLGQEPDIINSIFWGNSLGQIYGNASVTYCDVEGGYTGFGNFAADPRFVSGPRGDYYLSQITAGQANNSPCLDRGSDLAANTRMLNCSTRTDGVVDTGIVDMGYHYGSCCLLKRHAADIDENWHVDQLDYGWLAADWQNCYQESYLPGDITSDNCVNINDLRIVTDCWLQCYVTKANNLVPPDYATGVDPNVQLIWGLGEGALYHDVYLGTDDNAVANAEHGSPEFMGTISEADFDPCGLDWQTAYYWRIDEVGPACVTKGQLWRFTTSTYSGHNLPLVGHWKFDEGEGTTAYDSAGSNHGIIYDAQWVTGQFNNGLIFDGSGDYVSIAHEQDLNITGDITISAWVNFRKGQYQHAIVAKREGNGTRNNPFDFRTRYCFTPCPALGRADASGSELAKSLGGVPIGQWGHVLVRVENKVPDFYINGTVTEKYGDTIFTKTPTGNTSPVLIGMSLDGLMDDVRIYNRALSAVEIMELYQDEWDCNVTEATNPEPANQATCVNPNMTLSWVPGEGTLNHDVYLGTDANAVANAGHLSQEFMGTVSEAHFDPCSVEWETTYYWRIDEVGYIGTAQGYLWSFTTCNDFSSNLVGWWKFDDGSGGTATDSAGTNNGTLNGDPTWATGRFDGALSFDGNGDYVSVAPIVPLTGNTVTAQAWIRLDKYAGIYNPILTQNTGNNGYYFDVTSGKPSFHIVVSPSYVQAISPEVINTDQWYYVAGTNDGSNLKLYIDGQLEDSAFSTGFLGVNNIAKIGGEPGSSLYFTGIIDDVRIYDRALTAGEILQLYQEGLN